MFSTRVKICGLTRPEDAVKAGDLGVDALGLNFIAGPRKLSLSQGAAMLDVISPLVTTVGLVPDDPAFFREHTAADRAATLRVLLGMSQYQVYNARPDGAVTSTTPARFWLVYSIARRDFVPSLRSMIAACARPPVAILLDTASPKLGGSGQIFNWNWISEAREAGELERLPPIVLAGGLTPENVAEAIRIARPYAVDVSSGVEVAGKPGVKDPIKMRDFIQAARG